MKLQWLIKNNKSNLIIFFNGWAMDAKPFEFLGSDDFDVLMLCDYRDFNIDLKQLTEGYSRVCVVAWSMGVWAAGLFLGKIPNLSVSIAINGTGLPVDADYGIAPRMFDMTYRTLSEKTRAHFYKNMFSSDEEFDLFMQAQPHRSVEEQKEELALIKELYLKQSKVENKFDIAIVGKDDKIIPSKNQLNYWNSCAISPIVEDMAHHIFYKFTKWDEVISYGQ